MNKNKQYPTLSVVIPVFNESKTLEKILYRVFANDLVTEIVIVDDSSTDDSYAIIQSFAHRSSQRNKKKILISKNKKNIGKGGSLRVGFKMSTSDIIVIQDADLEYNPVDYIKLIQPIADNRADVVYGSRFIGGTHRVLYFWHYLGNKILTIMSNIFSNLNLTDMETCYKMFRKEILNEFELKSNRFGFEPEFTAKIAKANLRIYEMPISYDGRTYKDGKKITWRDGIAAFYHIFYYNLSLKFMFILLLVISTIILLLNI